MTSPILQTISALAKRFLLFLLLLISISASARNWIFQTTGRWTDASSWLNGYPGTTINAGDTVYIAFGAQCSTSNATPPITINGVLVMYKTARFDLSSSMTCSNSVIINGGSTFTNFGSLTFLKGKLRIDGTLINWSTATMSVKCAITNTGLLNNSGTLNIVGVNGGNTGTIDNTSTGIITNSKTISIIGMISNSGSISNTSTGVITDSMIFRHEDGTFTNDGSLIICKNAILDLHGDPVVTSGGTITSAGNIVVGFRASFTNNGTLQNNYQITNSGAFVNNGKISSIYSIGNSSDGNMVNNGTITLNPSNQNYPSTLSQSNIFTNTTTGAIYVNPGARIGNADTLYNNGSINLAASNSIIYNRSGGEKPFTNIIINSGVINSNGIIYNESIIRDMPASTYTNSGGVINTGSFEENGTFNNQGTFENDSLLTLNAGSFTTGNSAFFKAAHRSLFNIYGQYTNAGTMLLLDSSIVEVMGTFTNQGTVSIQEQCVLLNMNSGVFTNSIEGQRPATIDNRGFFLNWGTLTNSAGFYSQLYFQNLTPGTVTNTGDIRNSKTFQNDYQFINNGNFITEPASTISNNGVFTNIVPLALSGQFTNNSGGVLKNSAANFVISANGILENNGGSIQNGSGPQSNTAARPGKPPSIITNNGTFNNTGTFTNYDSWLNENYFTNNIAGTVVNNGYFTNDSSVTNIGTFTNYGTMTLNNKRFTNSLLLRNNGQLIIQLTSQLINVSPGSILNDGTLANGGSMTSSIDATIVNFFSATITGYKGTVNNYSFINEPVNTTAPVNSVVVFTVSASGAPISYQWQVSTDNGTTWNYITDGGNYSGSNTANLQITNVPASFNSYQYKAIANGPEDGNTGTSVTVTLTVTGG